MLATAHAQDVRRVPTSPLVSRYQGSRLVAWQTDAFASVVLPSAHAAPLASNASDAGRARNRRVELVAE